MKHKLAWLLVILLCSIYSVGFSANNGVLLDGVNDYVSVPTATRLDLGMTGATGITVEAWINPTSLRSGADTNRNIIMDFGIKGTDSMVSMYLRENGKIRFGGRSSAADGFQAVVTDNIVITTGSWQHVAGVLDFVNKAIYLYVDGTLVKSKTTGVNFSRTTFLPSTGGNQYIGSSASGSSSQFFHGIIDDMRLWSFPRTETQINAYKDTEVSAQTGLLAYWKFNEISGVRIAQDSSGNNYAGELKNEADFVAGNETLPVELSSFTATISTHNNVVLTWVTQSETSVMGFYVYRSTDSNLANAQQITSLIDATNTSDQQVYVYTDNEINQIGTYYYWLMVSDMNGSESFHGPIHVTYENTQPGIPNIPVFTELKQVYPNPFNPNTNISYVLATPSDVSITIYNSRGQEVRSFEKSNVAAGTWNLSWDGKDQNGTGLSSGVYYIRMNAGQDSFMKKAVLMK